METINQKNATTRYIMAFLKKPITIIMAFALGAYIGFYMPEMGKSFKPVGDLYMSLLKISIIPFVVLSITSNISKMISDKSTAHHMKSIIGVFVISLIIVAVLGILAALILNPGAGFGELSIFRDIVEQSGGSLTLSVGLNEALDKNLNFDLMSFLVSSIPSNIFDAFSQAKILQIVIFSILFGVSVGYLPTKTRENITNFMDGVQHSFILIIKGVVSILPIGVFFVVGSQFSNLTADILVLLVKFIASAYAIMIFIFIGSTVIIWKSSGRSFSETMNAFKLPVLVSMITQNSLVAMPLAIQSLVEKLGFNKVLSNLIMPLGISINRFGNVLYFAFVSIFIAQVYNTDIGMMGYVIAIVGSIFAGFATSGVTSIATLGMVDIVLSPLGLPVGAVLIILTAIDPLIDPIRTLTIVHTNAAVTAFLARNKP